MSLPETAPTSPAAPVLAACGITKRFTPRRRAFGGAKALTAVDRVSFALKAGNTLSLVGESGRGKSTTARLVTGLLDLTDGEVLLNGQRISGLPERRMHALRRKIQIVFQDPCTSLNPRLSIGTLLRDPLENYGIGTARDRDARVAALLEQVGLRPDFAARYPHQLSGGQCQRIGIARALSLDPDVIVLDEAVSALDLSVQAQILNLLNDLQAELGLACLFISHDLSVVRHISDRVAVMYLGSIVEEGPSDTLFATPGHPYTRMLLDAVPVVNPALRRHSPALTAEVPDAANSPRGCAFHPRCSLASEACRREKPRMTGLGGGHRVACFAVEPRERTAPMTTNFDPVAFTAELVRIPSCDPPGGDLAVARTIADRLHALGLEPELDAFQPGRANVLCRIRGRGEQPPLVFSAHMDTVPVGGADWAFDPFAGDLVAGRLCGRGSSDMKSALAAFIAAADRLNRRPAPLAGDVILAFTAGESADCLGARHLLAQGVQREIGAFLCGEPSSLDLIVVETAVLWLELEARGTLGHVSGAAGVNAISIMAEAIAALFRLHLDLPGHPLLGPPSVNVGRISGGSTVNVTPDRCRAEIDIRFGPGIDPDTVIVQLDRALPPGIGLRQIDFKPAVEEAPDSAFVACCAAAVRGHTGAAPAVKGVSYYSDGTILLQGLDVPFCILGPGDLGMSGQPNETADTAAIRAAAEIYETIAEAWPA